VFDDSSIPVSDALLTHLGLDAPMVRLAWAMYPTRRKRAIYMLAVASLAEQCDALDVVQQEQLAHHALAIACAIERPQGVDVEYLSDCVHVLTKWQP
jgi:hypothetical protein